jgi:hypothetical protein
LPSIELSKLDKGKRSKGPGKKEKELEVEVTGSLQSELNIMILREDK